MRTTRLEELIIYLDNGDTFNCREKTLWTSQMYEVPAHECGAIMSGVVEHEILDLAEALVKHKVEVLTTCFDYNLKEEYARDNMEVIMLVEHIKDWLLCSSFKGYTPLNPGSYNHSNPKLIVCNESNCIL